MYSALNRVWPFLNQCSPIRRAICGAHRRVEIALCLHAAGCHLCQASNIHIYSALYPEHTGTRMFMYAHMYTKRHWFWSQHVAACQCDTEGAQNSVTSWLLSQIRTIKNRPWDNEPGWHTCSWRSNSKDVSQLPSIPHLIMTSKWLRAADYRWDKQRRGGFTWKSWFDWHWHNSGSGRSRGCSSKHCWKLVHTVSVLLDVCDLELLEWEKKLWYSSVSYFNSRWSLVEGK